MASFTTQITDYIADAVATGDIGVTEAMLDQWMADGVKYIILRVPKRLWERFSAVSAEQTADGYASQRPIRVLRESGTDDDFVECRKIPPTMANDYGNIAAATNPVWYHQENAVYVLPTPGADPNAYKVVEVKDPSIDASADDTIDNFPTELYETVIKFAVIQCKLREFALMRRKAQDEIESAATAIGNAATANNNAMTEIDKIAAVIATGSGEFDKISALLDKGETDSETPVNTAITALKAAADKIATAVGLANVEFDLVNPDIDDGDTILDDDEDVQRTASKLSVSTTRIANGRAYLEEAMADLNEAQAYAQEVNSRLSQASTKRQEGGSRAQAGSAFLSEAASIIANGQGWLASAAGNIGEAQVRANEATYWLNMGVQAASDKSMLQKEIDNNIANFIA